MRVYLFEVLEKRELVEVRGDEDVNIKYDDWLREEVEGGFMLYEFIKNKKDDEN